jgi:hypothetical protein
MRWNVTGGARIDYGQEFAEMKLEDISEEKYNLKKFVYRLNNIF